MGKVRIIKASAGSGKTFRLAYEFIRSVIKEPLRYRHILAVTFTNKATEEMKRRILSELDLLARGADSGYMQMLTRETGLCPDAISSRAKRARTRILHDYSRFSVLTIDKFFQRIIRSFVRELGVDLNFNLELQTDGLVSRTADALIERMSDDTELRTWLSEYVEERIDDNRRWDIKSGIAAIGSELFRENFKRIASEAPDKATLRSVIKTAAAKYHSLTGAMRTTAGEAMQIMESAGLCVADFSYGRSGVAGHIAKIASGKIEDHGSRVDKALADDGGWCSKSSSKKGIIEPLIPALRDKLATACGIYRDNSRFFASYSLLKDNYRSFALLGDLARLMEDICAEESIMPISETNNILHKLISGNDTPFIFEKAGNHYDSFMIDEFQDTSTMQWENFLPLLQNALSQSDDSPVLLVGDVKQSIYRWRGGDWRILAQDVETSFEGATLPESLATNWRSRPDVVRFNNLILASIIKTADQQLNERLEEALSGGFIPRSLYDTLTDMVGRAYEGHSQHSSGTTEGGHTSVTFYGLADEEPTPPVISKIEELQSRGFRAGDIAILVRYNADGVKIADMLLEHKRLNPGSPYCYDVVTQEALTIGSSPAVNFIMACMRLSEGDTDIPQRVFYNNFLGREYGAEIPATETDFLSSVRRMPVMEALDAVTSWYRIDDPTHTAYIQALHDQILSWTASRVGDLPLFIKWWDETGCNQSIDLPSGGDAITIVSIHKSKGLEYKAVIVPYCNWGLTPGRRSLVWTSSEGGGFDELGTVPVPFGDRMAASHFSPGYYRELVMSHIDNINLFYVAVTRAGDELHLMIPGIPKDTGKISSLVYGALPMTGDTVEIGGMKGNATVTENEIRLSFGTPICHTSNKERKPKADTLNLTFCSYPTSGRVRQKRAYLRFEEEGATPTITPRDYGILLHSLFEKAQTRDDIYKGIEILTASGEITPAESTRLHAMVDTALAVSPASEWFAPAWDRVLTERDILIPGSYNRRPDRVMIRKNETVVVDYKFGAIRDESHKRQVGKYMDLLSHIQNGPIHGFVWYVTLGETVEVTPK